MKLKPCPIEGCKKQWQTRSGLEGHLYINHRKAEIINIYLNLTEAYLRECVNASGKIQT